MTHQLILHGACNVAGVTALAAALLYALWAIGVQQGKVLVIRSDRYLAFRAVCLIPFFILTPVLFICYARFAGVWAVAALMLYHLTALGQHVFSPLWVSLYNVNEDDALMAVMRALVLAGWKFREENKRFVTTKGEPIAEVVFKGDKPEGTIQVLPGGSLPLYRLLAASCVQSPPTPGASALPFLLSVIEFACVGLGSLSLAVFSKL